VAAAVGNDDRRLAHNGRLSSYRSVIMPSNASAAEATVSDSIGCWWMLSAASAASSSPRRARLLLIADVRLRLDERQIDQICARFERVYRTPDAAHSGTNRHLRRAAGREGPGLPRGNLKANRSAITNTRADDRNPGLETSRSSRAQARSIG
jgi:hypothetical protein